MEGVSSGPSGSSPVATGASKFLANLPSRGFLASAVVSSNLGGMRVYVCDHDTSPPEGQQIKTNQTNILIRSLQHKEQKGNTTPKDVKAAFATEGSSATESLRKRAPERPADGRASAKRNNNQNCSRQEVSQSSSSTNGLHTLTVERLRALLKERGLSPKGKKDELVARLKSASS